MTAGAFRTGDMLGNEYVLGDVLGTGGMGIVFAAAQPRLGRTVALKVLRPELAGDAMMVQRFRNEALAASRVSHPNIVGIIDFATSADGAHYLVMAQVRGRRLGELLADGALPCARATRLCGQLLSALAATHAAGIVHGDVKSDNFLVETLRDGSELVTLIDFGLARFAGAVDTSTPHMVSGTPEYLAPEVIRGAPPSPTSDVYGAGVILYELLTGSTPFAGGTSHEILARHNAEAVIPPSRRCADRDIPSALEGVVLRALEKSPANRFATAAAFADALVAAGRSRATDTWELASGTGSTAVPVADPDAIATTCLELVGQLVDGHQLQAAADELERAIARLVEIDSTARTGPLWRLTLALAGLYDGLGNRVRARSAAFAALGHAASAGSDVGRARAKGLIERLATTVRSS